MAVQYILFIRKYAESLEEKVLKFFLQSAAIMVSLFLTGAFTPQGSVPAIIVVVIGYIFIFLVVASVVLLFALRRFFDIEAISKPCREVLASPQLDSVEPNDASLFQDFVSLPELPVFAFQRFTSISVNSGFPVSLTAVRLSASNPIPKRIRSTANLGRNRFDRSVLGFKCAVMFQHHPYSPFAHFG